jgi:pimeloyl-ACP methyl ester carboxylesterase
LAAALASATSATTTAEDGRLRGGAEIVLTDRDPAAVRLARENVASNAEVIRPSASASSSSSSSGVAVTAAELDWDDDDGLGALLGRDATSRESGAGGGDAEVAMILAADVVYHEDSFAPLVHALDRLAGDAGEEEEEEGRRDASTFTPLVYLAYRRRCDAETAAHFFHLLDARFERRRVSWRWPFPRGSGARRHPGGEDATLFRLTPRRRHEAMAALIPYAELAVIHDAGHLPTLEAPDAVTAALRVWLKQPLVLQTRADA